MYAHYLNYLSLIKENRMKLVKTLAASLLVLGAVFGSQVVTAETAQTNNTTPVVEQPVVIADKLNINTATATEIQKALVGIGAKKAEAIVQYREKHGNFTAAEQLLEVQGIGKATLEKNKDRLVF